MAALAPQSYLTGLDGHSLFSEALLSTSFYDSYAHMVGQESQKVDELEQLLLLDSSLQTDFLLNNKWPYPQLTEGPIPDLSLFCEPDQTSFSESPHSSLPSSPDSVQPLISPEEQEINEIVSSFQDDTPYLSLSPPVSNSLYAQLVPSYLSDSSPPASSPLSTIAPSPVSPVSFVQPKDETYTHPSPKPVTKRSSKLTTKQRKERKKDQNKTAALRYRQKKKDQLGTLIEQEKALETTNKKLKMQVESLSTEIEYLKRLWTEIQQVRLQKQQPIN